MQVHQLTKTLVWLRKECMEKYIFERWPEPLRNDRLGNNSKYSLTLNLLLNQSKKKLVKYQIELC